MRAVCEAPECTVALVQTGRGRPRSTCSDACRMVVYRRHKRKTRKRPACSACGDPASKPTKWERGILEAAGWCPDLGDCLCQRCWPR